jgi:hypothetical protein
MINVYGSVDNGLTSSGEFTLSSSPGHLQQQIGRDLSFVEHLSSSSRPCPVLGTLACPQTPKVPDESPDVTLREHWEASTASRRC